MADSTLAFWITAHTEDAVAKVKEMAAEVKSSADDVSTSGSKMGSALSTFGGVAAAGIGIAVGASVALAVSFQQATAKLQANADISAASAKKIGDAFLSTAGQTVFSAKQMVDAYASVVAQLQTTEGHALDAKQALDFMRQAMDLAEASGTSLNNATSDLAAVLQVYKINLQGAGAATDDLYEAAKRTGLGVDTVTTTINRLGPAALSSGISLAQMSGALVDVASNGNKGRQAVSALNTLIADLTTPTTKQAAAFAFLGISLQNANGQFIGLGPALDAIKSKLDGLNPSQQKVVLADILGQQAAQKLFATIEGGSASLAKYTDLVNQSGTAHAAATVAEQTLTAQFEKAKSAIEDVATELGDKLLPVLARVAEGVADVVNWLSKHKEVAIALAAAVGSVLVVAMGAFAASLIATAAAAIGLDIALLPLIATVGVIAAVVAALAVGLYELITHFDTVKSWVTSNWPIVVGVLTLGFGTVIAYVAQHWHEIYDDIVKVIDQIKGYFAGAITWLTKFGSDLVTGFWNGVKSLVGWLTSQFLNLIATIKNWFKDAIGWLFGAGSDVIHGLWNGVAAVVGWLTGNFNNLIDTLKGWFKDAGDWLVNAGSDLIHGFWSGVSSLLGWLSGNFSNMIGTLKGWFASASSWLISAGAQTIEGFFGGVAEVWGAVSSWFGGIGGRIVGAIGNLSGILFHVGASIIQGLWDGVKSLLGSFLGFLGGIASDIKNAKGPPDKDYWILYPAGQNIMQGLNDSIKAGVPGVLGTLGDLTSSISGTGTALSANFGASVSSLGGSAVANSANAQPIYLQIDGTTFAKVMVPYNRQALLQTKRATVTLGLA